jgi:hypothetical protein
VTCFLFRESHAPSFPPASKQWTYRTTEKNIGIPYYQIREALAALPGMIM